MVVFYFLNTIFGIGGISTITSLKIKYLIDNHNYDIVVFVKYHPKNYEEQNGGKFKIVKLQSDYLGLSVFGKIKYAFQFFWELRLFTEKFKPTIIVSTLTSIDFFTIPIAFRKLPLILEIHATSNIIIQWSHFIKKPFYKLYSKVVFLNEVEESIYNFRKSIVIPNFISQTPKLDLSDKKRVIISGGRNDVIKQWHHQIEAWNKIFNQLPDWEFHLYIDGEDFELDQYRNLVHRNCENLKIFKASQSFKKSLKEASLMVLSSKVECFPMNILEAFSFGTVVVSYATSSGPISLIENGNNGILVDQNNIKDLAEAILRISKNEKLRIELAKNAKKTSSFYSSDIIMERWISLFDSLIHEGS